MKKELLEKLVTNSLLTVTLILMPLNMLGGIIAGIWLAILGDWIAIFAGLALSIGGPFFLSFPLAASLIFVMPAASLYEKGKIWLSAPFIFLATASTYLIIIIWCTGILLYFKDFMDGSNYIPMLIWIYSTAVAPWVYMAQKESQGPDGNTQSAVTAFFTQVGFIVALIGFTFFNFDLISVAITQVIIHLFGIAIAVIDFLEEQALRKRLSL